MFVTLDKIGLVILIILSLSALWSHTHPDRTDKFGGHSDEQKAIADATRDAKLSDQKIWIFAGGCGNFLGVLVTYAVQPSVPPEKLLGKSPEYVAYYTSTYQAEVKKERIMRATTGCVSINVGLVVLYWTTLYTFETESY